MKTHIGIKIKMARIAKGLTQAELAEKIHKTRPLISHIEQTGKVHQSTLSAIIKCLDMTAADLDQVNENLLYHTRPSEMDPVTLRLIQSLEREIETLKKHIALQEDLIMMLRGQK